MQLLNTHNFILTDHNALSLIRSQILLANYYQFLRYADIHTRCMFLNDTARAATAVVHFLSLFYFGNTSYFESRIEIFQIPNSQQQLRGALLVTHVNYVVRTSYDIIPVCTSQGYNIMDKQGSGRNSQGDLSAVNGNACDITHRCNPSLLQK